MPQPDFPTVRQAIATYLTSSIGLRATANRFGQVNPPMAVVHPQTGSLIRYAGRLTGSLTRFTSACAARTSCSPSWYGDSVCSRTILWPRPCIMSSMGGGVKNADTRNTTSGQHW